MFTFWLLLTYNLLEDRWIHLGDVINVFWFLCDKTCCCASVQSSNHVVEIHVTSVAHLPNSSCAKVLFLPHFVIYYWTDAQQHGIFLFVISILFLLPLVLSFWFSLPLTILVLKVKSDHHSKFFNLSNWKEEAWKKIRASTGFKPVTSAVPVRCSTNWAMKPHIGRELNLLSSYLPVQ